MKQRKLLQWPWQWGLINPHCRLKISKMQDTFNPSKLPSLLQRINIPAPLMMWLTGRCWLEIIPGLETQAKARFRIPSSCVPWIQVTPAWWWSWKIIAQTIFSPRSPAHVLEMALITEISKHIWPISPFTNILATGSAPWSRLYRWKYLTTGCEGVFHEFFRSCISSTENSLSAEPGGRSAFGSMGSERNRQAGFFGLL